MNKIIRISSLLFLCVFFIASKPVKKEYTRNNVNVENNPLIKFNRISLPIFGVGQIGNSITDNGQYVGVIDTIPFLHSSGFLLSGYNQNGELWSNGVEYTRKILDYVKGTVDNPNDPKGLYTISIDSEPFGEEWQEWKFAVKLGAEFYDGDKDGIYNPVDLNQNGTWDENEDRPVLYGDVMTWSAFNDGVPSDSRKIIGVEPQGINIRQTVWGYQNNPNLEKVVFVKYSIENTGKVSQVLSNVNFSLTADPDLGYYRNDYLATDVQNNSILTYSPYNDYYLNEEQIALSTTMIQGPIVKNGSKGYKLIGENLEQVELPIGSNADIIASVNSKDVNFSTQFYQSFSPDLIREIMVGDNNPDPCNTRYSEVMGIPCTEVDKRFIYSGDPIAQKGWNNTGGSDKEFLLSTGSFNLTINEPIEIIYAFAIGINDYAVDAMKEAIKSGREVKYNFFNTPERFTEVNPITITDDESIELLWNTVDQAYNQIDGYGYNINFEGFEIHMYNSQSTSEYVNSRLNKKLIARYDLRNLYDNFYIESNNDFSIEPLYEKGNQIYAGERLLHKISWDPFNNEPLRKGKPYYFSITPFGIDHNRVVKYGIDNSYLIPSSDLYSYFANEPQIINDDKGNIGIVIGENQNDAFYKGVIAEHKEGSSEAIVSYSVYEQESVSNDLYEVSFEKVDADIYTLLMNVTNISQNYNILQKLIHDDFSGSIDDMREGFVVDVDWIKPGRVNWNFEGEKWFNEFDNISTGIFYVGSDVPESQNVFPITLNKSRAIKIDDLRNVELRFSDSSKALRYVRTAIRYPWKGKSNPDSGFVKIPVSAYSIDNDGTETKLQIGFIENGFPFDSLGMPNGIWNPGTDISQSKEYLVVFNRKYSENLDELVEYTGTQRRLADIANGYLIYDSEVESDSIRAIARSPWFNAMYVIGVTTPFYQADFNPTGILKINPSLVLTENDKYLFKVKKEKTIDEKKEQFDKINVYPNPLFAYNANSAAYGFKTDEPFVTFSNLPEELEIKIYSLSGNLVKTLYKNDKVASLRWDLKNESSMRIASGMYIAIINVPNIGQKILKFAIIQPQKNVHY